jgi:hypothetical protein
MNKSAALCGANSKERIMVVLKNSSLANEILFEEHYTKLLAEAQALPADDVQKVNLDAENAVTTALAVVPVLQRFRENIVTNLKDFNSERFDHLEDYPKAFSVSNSRYLAATNPPDALPDEYEAGQKLRELLHADVTNLIARGLIHSNALKDYTGLVGFRNVGMELQLLALILKDHWQSVQGRCGTDLAELENALKLAQRLQRGAGEREFNPAIVAEYADIRNRLFTLFIRAYDDARRAIAYLRWEEGDADEIAPSLHISKASGASKKKADKKNESIPVPVASSVQTTTHVTSSPSTSVTPATKTGTVSEHGPFVTE